MSNDPEYETLVKQTINKSLAIGAELMRRQVIAAIEHEIAIATPDSSILTVLLRLIAATREASV